MSVNNLSQQLENGTILKGRSIRELEEIFEELGEAKYRGKQAFRRINKHMARSLDEFSEFPKELRARLMETGAMPQMKLGRHESSKDGTEKLLFRLPAEHASRSERLIESVLIPSERRTTFCISSQSGCSLNCTFCATARLDFRGNLETWQIVDEVYELIRLIDRRPTNVVFMGMGEPFYNYDNVMRAARILHHPEGLNLGARHITISTAGVIPRIEQFITAREPFNLAVSLNHPNAKGRSEIMNVNKKYPLDALLKTLRKFTKVLNRKITFEYVLIPDVNMDDECARKLIKIARSIRCKLNLIPLNTKLHGWRRPTEAEITRFQDKLLEGDISVFNRGSPGLDINAACGMLAADS